MINILHISEYLFYIIGFSNCYTVSNLRATSKTINNAIGDRETFDDDSGYLHFILRGIAGRAGLYFSNGYREEDNNETTSPNEIKKALEINKIENNAIEFLKMSCTNPKVVPKMLTQYECDITLIAIYVLDTIEYIEPVYFIEKWREFTLEQHMMSYTRVFSDLRIKNYCHRLDAININDFYTSLETEIRRATNYVFGDKELILALKTPIDVLFDKKDYSTFREYIVASIIDYPCDNVSVANVLIGYYFSQKKPNVAKAWFVADSLKEELVENHEYLDAILTEAIHSFNPMYCEMATRIIHCATYDDLSDDELLSEQPEIQLYESPIFLRKIKAMLYGGNEKLSVKWTKILPYDALEKIQKIKW